MTTTFTDWERNDLERKDSSQSFPITIHSDPDQFINRLFIGRLGGNQAFTVSRDDPDYDEKLRCYAVVHVARGI
jgi:hypothetical protein